MKYNVKKIKFVDIDADLKVTNATFMDRIRMLFGLRLNNKYIKLTKITKLSIERI